MNYEAVATQKPTDAVRAAPPIGVLDELRSGGRSAAGPDFSDGKVREERAKAIREDHGAASSFAGIQQAGADRFVDRSAAQAGNLARIGDGMSENFGGHDFLRIRGNAETFAQRVGLCRPKRPKRPTDLLSALLASVDPLPVSRDLISYMVADGTLGRAVIRIELLNEP